jgi:hypothetical protein
MEDMLVNGFYEFNEFKKKNRINRHLNEKL